MENALLFLVVLLGFLLCPSQSKLVQDEVDALQQIVRTMGAAYWKFDDVSCQVQMVGVTKQSPWGAESTIRCDCQLDNNTCHVVSIVIKGYSLPGVLPPELVKLPFVQSIDFAYNYLSGGIPLEWASLQLKSISLLANRLSGEIPKVLGNITSLTYLNLEANQFTGKVPDELGKLYNLGTLILSSNRLTGVLPAALARLGNLTDFRINDNNLVGAIPGYIPNWQQLDRLEMHASGLHGPIPPSISLLNKVTRLIISDIEGTTQGFPVLSNMAGLRRLVLRNCSITGEIPGYIWKMKNLQMLDVSFNKLVGEVPDNIGAQDLKFMQHVQWEYTWFIVEGWKEYLYHVPEEDDSFSMLACSDLSYNNFTWQDPGQPTCRQNMNFNLNLFRSSSTDACSVHVNCGGVDLTVADDNRKFLYQGDASVGGSVATYYDSSRNYWGFSSTGDFMDDNDSLNIRYLESLPGSNSSDLYATARLAPISLTYFAYCLENGNYTVKLHFEEIQFTDDKTFSSLGRRFFDIYIQDILIKKDFNIEDEAHGAQKPLVREFNSRVTNNKLEIRFQWAGRGTTKIPHRGVYGPLISAISVNPNFKCFSSGKNKRTVYVAVAAVFSVIVLLASFIFWWKCCVRGRSRRTDLGDLQLQAGGYTLKQIKIATNNFDPVNKIGEGGFGTVYKGLLRNGTFVAVKQLASKSKQGNREFLNEIGMISCLHHPNLVKLHGFCVEGDQLLLVYEYMENNSLAHVLFGPERTNQSQVFLDWHTRVRICLGIARGLAFLHEDSRLKIVHRDIKATNVLLDKDLNPKISDFGLARLEYAIWGHLSYKADVYSYGVVVLETISGRSNSTYVPAVDCFCLLDWTRFHLSRFLTNTSSTILQACHLQLNGNSMELVDQRLGSSFNIEEAEKMVKVALLCTNVSPTQRPTMSEVVSMLEGNREVPDVVPDPANDFRFRSMSGMQLQRKPQDLSVTQSEISTAMQTDIVSSSMSFDHISPSGKAS
ncbi:hypothetical protein Cgig2_029380 [Carnegiea gigantea]|uniref:non-specific serine/threonine protein kinase n=1 Tax=Carnegiea gigantea TaxID=171969 RepID=A0A9Q1KW68_9CARY|nr:hypothetical protein Cgig2_029380 [Carnegiea gigantea]